MNLQQNKPYVSSSTMKAKVALYVPSYGTQTDEGKTPVEFTLQGYCWGDWRPDGHGREIEDLKLTYNKVGRLFIYFGVTLRSDYQIEVYGIRYTVHSINDVGNQHQYNDIILKAEERVNS